MHGTIGVATHAASPATITLTNASTITRSDGGSFITDGFKVGVKLRLGGTGAAMWAGDYTIIGVTATTITLAESLPTVGLTRTTCRRSRSR